MGSCTERNGGGEEFVAEDRSEGPSQPRVVVSRALGGLALLAALSFPVQAAPCGVPVGHSVALKSGDLDPDVFVWDTRQRVVEYASGHWGDTRDVIAHTVLAKPGTRAVIVQCAPGLVRREGTDARDAVGVRLVNGPNKGRYGWVTSDDVHEVAIR